MNDIFDIIDSNLAAITPAQDRYDDADWMRQRMGRFTASRIGDLMSQGRAKNDEWGKMADRYIFEKIGEIITGVPHQTPETRAIQWGIDHEPEAIEFYNGRHAGQIDAMGTMCVQFNDMAGGSPDGFIGDDTIVEVKCPYVTANHIKWLVTGEIDDKGYEFQCQANMLFSGREKCRFISYDPRIDNDDLKLAVIDVAYDAEIGEAIRQRIDAATDRLLAICEKYRIDFLTLKQQL